MFPRIQNLVLITWLFVVVHNVRSVAIDGDQTNSEKGPEDISVWMANSTTIILSWKLYHNFTDGLQSLIIWHRPRNPIEINLPRFEYSNVIKNYRAWYGADEAEQDWKIKRFTEFFEEPELSSENEMLIVTTDLLPSMKYDFVIHRIASNISNFRTAKIIAETPPSAPQSGAGCFRVVDVGFATRKVHFYWMGFEQQPGDYDIEIREEGPCLAPPVFKERGPFNRGFKEVTISKKRHWFFIRKHEQTEAGVAVVYIPHQEEVFDGPTNLRLAYDQSKSLYSLTWSKPDGVRVTNYTIFWMGTRRNRRTIMNIMHIPGDRTSFEVTSKEDVTLFLAANANEGSSGLGMPVSYPED